MSSAQPLWDLTGRLARARHARAQAFVDLQSPGNGVQIAQWQDQPTTGLRILGVDLPDAEASPPLSPEAYVRGGDLVATYPATAGRSCRVQVYWRLHATSDRLIVDLQVSVQTHLLDAAPRVQLVTHVPAAQVDRLASTDRLQACDAIFRVDRAYDHCVVALAGGGWRYFEMVHPDDLVELQGAASSEGATLTHALFDERLEKGVILRARLRGVLTAAGDDSAQLAAEAYRDFLAAPLPLST